MDGIRDGIKRMGVHCNCLQFKEPSYASSHHLIRVGTFQDVPTLSIFAY